MSVNELLLLKRSFERLDRQYRSAEEKIGEFRDKLREARLELATKDRQLDAAKKLLAKLGQERSELAVVAEQNRELSRTLGAKLALGPEVPELQAKLQRSKRKVSELAAQLHEAQTRLLMTEEVGRQQATEVAVLKKALGLRSEVPELGAGYDGQAQLLQALAKSQEESASLAAQLAEGSRRTASLEQQVSSLQAEVERLAGLRASAEEAAAAARRETGEAHGRASSLQIDVEDLQAQLRRTSAHLQEVQVARSTAEESVDSLTAKNRQLQDKLAAAERAGKAQAESLRSELRSLAESAEAEVQQLHALHAAREGGWEVQLADLQRQLTEAQTRLSQSERDHEVETLRLQSRIGALEASLEGSRLREASLERDAEALREEGARLARANNELTANLAAARNEAEAYAERAEEAANNTDSERRLRMQVQLQLEASTTRAAVREEQLAAEASRMRGELAGLTAAKEKLQADLKLCQEKLSDTSARQSTNERHIEELHATIQSLTKSKTKLQNTMLEQLSLFKSKLHQVEHENLTLRTALATSASASASPLPYARGAEAGHHHRGLSSPPAGTAATGGGAGDDRSGGIAATAAASGGGGSGGSSSGLHLTLRDFIGSGAAASRLSALSGGDRPLRAAGEVGTGVGTGWTGGGSTTTGLSTLAPSLRDSGIGSTSVSAGGGGSGGGGGHRVGTTPFLQALRGPPGGGIGGGSSYYRSEASSTLLDSHLSNEGKGLGAGAGDASLYDE